MHRGPDVVAGLVGQTRTGLANRTEVGTLAHISPSLRVPCPSPSNMLLTTFLTGPKSRARLPIIHFVRAYTVLADAPVPKKKVWDSADSAVDVVKSGDVLLSGGTVCR